VTSKEASHKALSRSTSVEKGVPEQMHPWSQSGWKSGLLGSGGADVHAHVRRHCPVTACDWAGQAPIELQVTTSKFGMAWTKALGRSRSGLGRHQLTLRGMARASLSLLFVPPPNLLHIRSSSFVFSPHRPSTIFITSRPHRDPCPSLQGKQTASFGFCRCVSKLFILRLVPVHQNGYVSPSLHVAVPSSPNPTVTDVISHF
jgi:hypothetical protein